LPLAIGQDFMSVEALLPQVVEIGTRILGAVALWFLGRLGIKVIQSGAAKAMSHSGLDPTLHRWALSIIAIVLNFVLILAILGVFGIQTTSFAALLAAAGLAIGAAWAGLLANFAAGLFLILFKPFKVGDEVTIAGVTGTVAEIGVFSTAIDTDTNVRSIIGNGAISTHQIDNFSINPYRLTEVKVQLQSGTQIGPITLALNEALADFPFSTTEAPPSVRVEAFNEFGPVLMIGAKSTQSDYEDVRRLILQKVADVLDQQSAN
jgi:small conductance mechanosensitive channel